MGGIKKIRPYQVLFLTFWKKAASYFLWYCTSDITIITNSNFTLVLSFFKKVLIWLTVKGKVFTVGKILLASLVDQLAYPHINIFMFIDNVHVSQQRYKLASSDLHNAHMTPVMFPPPPTYQVCNC